MMEFLKTKMLPAVLCIILSYSSAAYASQTQIEVADKGNTLTVYSNFGSVVITESEKAKYLSEGWSLTPVKLNNITQLPITFLESSSYSTDAMDIKELDFWGFDYLVKDNKIRMYYKLDYDITGYISLKVRCYDSYGNDVGEVDFNKYSEWVDVPSSTATFSIVVDSSYGNISSGEYYHCKQVDLYSMDGRCITVYDVQTPVYTSVGWYEAVTMYALDGRKITIPPYEVEAYKKVGWYDIYEYTIYLLRNVTNDYIQIGMYNEAIDTIEESGSWMNGTEYEYTVRLIKEGVMDKWRNAERCPIGVISYSIGEEYDVPTVTLNLRNISYKTIIAFRSKFTCYNVFGEVEESYYDTYYCDDTYLESGESASYTWKLYGADSVDNVKNIRITEIVFSDGTKW